MTRLATAFACLALVACTLAERRDPLQDAGRDGDGSLPGDGALPRDDAARPPGDGSGPPGDDAAAAGCNVLFQSGCSASQDCVAVENGEEDFARCMTTLGRRSGDPCSSSADCDGGLVCWGGGTPFPQCRAVCDLDQQPSFCEGNCSSLGLDLTIGGVRIGGCS